ncbi:glycerophosphodiester phosphodiesterase family protein [Staphylococcus xylosus]|uniref:glycerophosphodiester phosphodiesterase family protein n=1 Tax=Staphylococcus xylosus TaxID=1288 RepID=UPI0032010CAC
MKKLIMISLFSCFMLTGCKSNILEKDYITIAHRGASGSAPEHTYAAYDKAIEQKADYLELDLQMTKDKKLIAMHDSDVSRTTNGKGLVKNKTSSDIYKLDAGSWFDNIYSKEKVPELSNVLKKYYNKTNFYIETKTPEMYPEMDKKLVEELNKKTLLTPHNLNNGKVIIQSFSLNSLTNIHKLNENIPLIKLVYDKDINKLNNKKLKKLSKLVYGIGINHKMVNKSLIKRAHDNGLKVHVFTLNNKKEVNEMRKLEVDGGFTNNP